MGDSQKKSSHTRNKGISHADMTTSARSQRRASLRFSEDDIATCSTSFFKKQSTILVFDAPSHIASSRVDGKNNQDIEKDAKAADTFRLHFKTPTYLSSFGSSFHRMFPDPVKAFIQLVSLNLSYIVMQKQNLDNWN